MTDESTVLNNLRTAHIGDWGVDLSSQEVHELWADIEAKEIISSCMQILSSQEVHELWADIEARDKRIAELEAERDDWRKSYINLWRHINNLPQPPEVQE